MIAQDLAQLGVPVVPTRFLRPGDDVIQALRAVYDAHPESSEIVVKPTVGAYSRDVGRYSQAQIREAETHIVGLFTRGCTVILQPYLDSIDRLGETDMIYFNGTYSHAIRKAPLLMADGTVNAPTTDTRSARLADTAEQAVARIALEAVQRHLGLDRPLLYARIDVIRDVGNAPVLLELEISEPSLSLPFAEGSAQRFAKAIVAAFASGTGATERPEREAQVAN